ncbi:MAG TPA: glycoside hydrolase family 76 protein [Mucilaginibacter sp.]|nr:glycoside hydrolase family 76 protein [Mucilaginibacter sp.]
MKFKYVNHLIFFTGCVFILSMSACSKKSDPKPDNTNSGSDTSVTTKPLTYDYASLADSLQGATYNTFISVNRNYLVQNNSGNTTFNYWPQAHVLDVLLDGYLRTSDDIYSARMKLLINGIKTQNGGAYPNEFYDDMGWLANASLRSYNATGDADYLNVAQTLYTEIKGGYNNTAGGGIAWQRSQLYYKNIPSTGNATILAAGFYQLNGNAADLTLAKDLYSWMKTKLVTSTGVVYDGINRNQDGLIDYWEFTYNQGLFIGSAIELYNSTKDAGYLQDAILVANNLIADPNLTVNGILKGEGQGDGGLFKGVAVRYLTQLVVLTDLNEADRTRYAAFLQRNAQTLYYKGIARPSLMISPDWTLMPSGSTDLTTQLSGVMMIEAAAKLKSAGFIQ